MLSREDLVQELTGLQGQAKQIEANLHATQGAIQFTQALIQRLDQQAVLEASVIDVEPIAKES